MTRRKRTDSLAGAKEIFDGAKIVLDPPQGIELGEGVRPYWNSLVTAKATRAWTAPDLLMLVELARNLKRTEDLSDQFMTVDPLLDTGQTVKPHPVSGIVDQLVKRARLLMVMLQIHPEATHGKSVEQKKQNQDHQAAQAVNEKAEKESLLASPH